MMSTATGSPLFEQSYQIGLLQTLLQCPNEAAELVACVDLEKAFDTELFKTIVYIITAFYNNYGEPPNLTQLQHECQIRNFNVRESLARLYSPVENRKYYLSKAFDFVQHMQLRGALLRASTALDNGLTSEAQNIFDAAGEYSTKHDLDTGLLLFSGNGSYECSFEDDDAYIPTGIAALDEIIGGLNVEELGVLIAPPGRGKSQFLTWVGVEAIKQEYNVIHYSLELSARLIRRRYNACITEISFDELPERSKEAAPILQRFHERSFYANSIIKEYPTKQADVKTLKGHLQGIKKRFGAPDLILVDYADLLRGRRPQDERRISLETIYEDLRALAKTEGVPIWTVSQGNRGTIDNLHYGMDGVAEALGKVMIADVVLTLGQGAHEINEGKFRLFIAKNRTKKSGDEITVHSDFSRSIFCTRSEYGNL